MIHADLDLARRLERAAVAIESEFARALAEIVPTTGSLVVPVADGVAIFAGIGSPMSQATGLGLDGPVTDADLDRLEEVYFSRGATARVVVCPLADESLASLLRRRGYGVSEFENTTVKTLRADDPRPPEVPGVEVRPLSEGEEAVYINAVGPSFAEGGVLTDESREMFAAMLRMRCGTMLLGRVEGDAAGGGSLLIHDGVAMLAGAATDPNFRRRGVHSALFDGRLKLARALGCDLAVMGAKPGSASQRTAERRGFRIAYTKIVAAKECGA